MKLLVRSLLLLPFIILLAGCPDDDAPAEIETRPYLDVYNEDILEIETFLDTHFMTVDADFNVTYTKITSTSPGTPINENPNLAFKTISKEGVNHKLYYIKLREGTGNTPTRLDSVQNAYKGLKTDLSVFDAASDPIWLQLQDVIQGWQEIFPEFKSGTSMLNVDGTLTYDNFGAGVMFVPSGLAYYNRGAGAIGAYQPIIFNFKIMNVRYKDHDGDKILSINEYGGPTTGTALDSDSDGNADYLDVDDDADGVLTKVELRNVLPAIPKTNGYYIYNSIPDCSGVLFGNPGFVKRRHQNASCQ